ncbi:ferric reductase-like transmembrane domain-containing protein [Streptacidiphilus griseoplanus]|uniref:ferric reductase-like transmembrane domain-containing protein n=1 Tax=Peterkaempfera griseoplana TaxID=66896 RepID=UPI0006E27FE4|nr:ferric reductase-like transmembrane domain-containing protein [Peterkaempfera griseoplana]
MTTAAVTARRPRTVPVLSILSAVLVLVLALSVLLAPAAAAAPPAIPGSPLDAYDKHTPYDTGVHSIARLAAIIAYALMVATVVFGAVLRLRFMQRAVNRQTIYGAHMTLALSALIFGAVHGVTFLYQPVWNIGLRELTLPFTGGVQRIPVGFGILGLELAVAVGCSVWLQRRLGYHRWLRFHQLAYAAFALIWLHVYTVHPEPRHLNPVAIGVAGGAGACLLAFLIRIFPSRSRLRQRSGALQSGAVR